MKYITYTEKYPSINAELFNLIITLSSKCSQVPTSCKLPQVAALHP
jgi:hypothetical protein